MKHSSDHSVVPQNASLTCHSDPRLKGNFFSHFFMVLKKILWRPKASIKPIEVPHRGVKTKLCTFIFTSKFFEEKHRRLYRVFMDPWRKNGPVKKYLELILFSEDNFCETSEKMWLFFYLLDLFETFISRIPTAVF